MVKIVVDRSRCVGLGVCELTAPAIFEVGKGGQVMIIVDKVSDAQVTEVEEAVWSCPTNALAIDP